MHNRLLSTIFSIVRLLVSSTRKIFNIRGEHECNMYITPDRRIKPRIKCEYPAIIEGNDETGGKFNHTGKLANLSASGLYMVTNRYIENGSKLSVTVLLTNCIENHESPKLATSGVVVRSNPEPDGMCGIAILFSHYRFL